MFFWGDGVGGSWVEGASFEDGVGEDAECAVGVCGAAWAAEGDESLKALCREGCGFERVSLVREGEGFWYGISDDALETSRVCCDDGAGARLGTSGGGERCVYIWTAIWECDIHDSGRVGERFRCLAETLVWRVSDENAEEGEGLGGGAREVEVRFHQW